VTAQATAPRRSLSLRSRLLAGLIALTACFLIVMGVVSSVVLGKLEQDQFNADLRLAVRQPITQVVKETDGFAAAYLSLPSGTYGVLTPDSTATTEMSDLFASLAKRSPRLAVTDMAARAPRGQPFTLRIPGQPPLRVAWRLMLASPATTGGYMPDGESIIIVAAPAGRAPWRRHRESRSRWRTAPAPAAGTRHGPCR